MNSILEIFHKGGDLSPFTRSVLHKKRWFYPFFKESFSFDHADNVEGGFGGLLELIREVKPLIVPPRVSVVLQHQIIFVAIHFIRIQQIP